MADATDLEDVESFRLRAREWLRDNMPRLDAGGGFDQSDEDRWDHDRHLQRTLWDGGFAGICFPAEHGGLGLTVAHHRAFVAESLPYLMPASLNVPTLSILAATLIDFGTHEQKARHLTAILRGDEAWVQFLSEPTGGSDLAGCITRANRDGDVWILNGSKIWSSAAYAADYAMCLARTNWDVPKHRGLTMFIVKIHQPGIHIDRIRQVNGSMEFCQEFFTDVPLAAADVIGEVDDGWTVASRLLMHERTAVGGGSPYTSGRGFSGESHRPDRGLVRLAVETDQNTDAHVRQLVAEAHVMQTVSGHLVDRVTKGMMTGTMVPPSGSLLKLFGATTAVRRAEIGVEIAGGAAVVWRADDNAIAHRLGHGYLSRQATCLGGGSNEMQRNIIAERVLGMPREWAADREVPYRDVRKNAMPSRPR